MREKRLVATALAVAIAGCAGAASRPAPPKASAPPLAVAPASVAEAGAPPVASSAPVLDAGAPAPRRTSRGYKGTIGKKTVYVRLNEARRTVEHPESDPERVSGRYFYDQPSNTDVLALAGTSTESAISLVETVDDKPTGKMTLTRKGDRFEGRWEDPTGKRSLPMQLVELERPVVVPRKVKDQARADHTNTRTGESSCQTEGASLEVIGLRSDEADESLNGFLAAWGVSPCESGRSDSVEASLLLQSERLLTFAVERSGFQSSYEVKTFDLAREKDLSCSDVITSGLDDDVLDLVARHPSTARVAGVAWGFSPPDASNPDRLVLERCAVLRTGIGVTYISPDDLKARPDVMYVELPWSEIGPLVARDSTAAAVFRRKRE